MNYKRGISADAIAVTGKKYPIYKSHVKVGDAEFLKMEDGLFEFEIHLSNLDPANFQFHFDVDNSTYELVSMRAGLKLGTVKE